MRMPTLPRSLIRRSLCSRRSFRDRPIRSKNRAKLERVCRLCRMNRGGVAAVEFALVAPLLFLLVFGMIEFGRMIMVQQIITNGSREGARLAVLDGITGTDVVAAVDNYLANAGISGANVDPGSAGSAGYGEPVAVTVTIPFNQVSWLPAPMFIGGDTVLSATSVMRRETLQ
jgi:Flp pilus assembly protein TadG